VEGVTLLSFFAKLFSQKSVDQAATAERRDNPLSLPSFLSCERKTPVKLLPQGFCKAFFKSVDQARPTRRARRFAFFAKLSFLRKKAERGGTLRFPPLKLDVTPKNWTD